MVEVFDVVGVTVFVTVVLALVPVVLTRAGVFGFLGKSKVGTKIASFLGSKEPTDFMRGACVVLFFLVLGYLFYSGITTSAIMYEIHKPVIERMEVCGNNFDAKQIGMGMWVINCHKNSLDFTKFDPSFFNDSDKFIINTTFKK